MFCNLHCNCFSPPYVTPKYSFCYLGMVKVRNMPGVMDKGHSITVTWGAAISHFALSYAGDGRIINYPEVDGLLQVGMWQNWDTSFVTLKFLFFSSIRLYNFWQKQKVCNFILVFVAQLGTAALLHYPFSNEKTHSCFATIAFKHHLLLLCILNSQEVSMMSLICYWIRWCTN
jgi:hypothetical protein